MLRSGCSRWSDLRVHHAPKPAIFTKEEVPPFSEARVEGLGKGSSARKRKDLRFSNRAGQLVLCGEVKLPGTPDGRSPYDDKLVRDAHEKADDAGCASGGWASSGVFFCRLEYGSEVRSGKATVLE